MKRARAAIAVWLALAPASARAADPTFAPSDFAWGRAVEVRESRPLQTLLLDVAIYRGAVAPDLADLRVFNAAGEVVPHAIRPLGDPSQEQAAPAPVPLFHVPEYHLVSPGELGAYIVLGVVGGLSSVAFVKMLLWLRAKFAKMPRASRLVKVQYFMRMKMLSLEVLFNAVN